MLLQLISVGSQLVSIECSGHFGRRQAQPDARGRGRGGRGHWHTATAPQACAGGGRGMLLQLLLMLVLHNSKIVTLVLSIHIG